MTFMISSLVALDWHRLAAGINLSDASEVLQRQSTFSDSAVAYTNRNASTPPFRRRWTSLYIMEYNALAKRVRLFCAQPHVDGFLDGIPEMVLSARVIPIANVRNAP